MLQCTPRATIKKQKRQASSSKIYLVSCGKVPRYVILSIQTQTDIMGISATLSYNNSETEAVLFYSFKVQLHALLNFYGFLFNGHSDE
jgi:hypothetical protein